MRITKRAGNYFACLLFNLLLNLELSIPAWVLLVLHYVIDVDIMWFWIALGVWVFVIISRMSIISWATRHGNEKAPPRENKNPYSAKNTDFNKNSKE